LFYCRDENGENMIQKTLPLCMIAAAFLSGCVPRAGTPAPQLPSDANSDLVPATLTDSVSTDAFPVTRSYPIVDTGQSKCYDNTTETICPRSGKAFFGQDAQYTGAPSSFTLSDDGWTVYDIVTGLTWQRSPNTNGDDNLNTSDKLTWAQVQALPAQLNNADFGGYSDWRLPSIKELYSLIDFRGTDPSGASGTATLTPFIDITQFRFAYGDVPGGERTIDSQYASNTLYVNRSFRGSERLFGVNFADGRIKGYELKMPNGVEKTFFVICVRGNTQYGVNHFVDNGNRTITDTATGLTWARDDSQTPMNWMDALAWVQMQNASQYLGHSDWRLPNAKELQSIVDYNRSPDTTNSAAIDPLFASTPISNEAGQADFPSYWTGTTHASSNGSGGAGIYIAFGRAMGYMQNVWMDVHGAGSQRSDPKSGEASQFPQGRGPQGDAIRILNYARLVRGGNVTFTPDGNPDTSLPSMIVESTGVQQVRPAGMPKPVAVTDCAGLNPGVPCTVSSPNGTVAGTCQPLRQQLACVPGDPP
jgi:hypothetical protein